MVVVIIYVVSKNKNNTIAYTINKEYLMTLNDGWHKARRGQLNDFAAIALINSKAEMYLFAFIEEKSIYNDFDDYKKEIFSQVKSNYDVDLNNVAYELVNIDGYGGLLYSFASLLDNIDYYTQTYIFENEKHYFVIYAWTLEKLMDINQDRLRNAALSFRKA